MKQFKEYLVEYQTGKGEMDRGSKPTEEEDAGRFISDMIERHDEMFRQDDISVQHPAENMSVIMALRNVYMGKLHGKDPEHAIHATPENLEKYMKIIKKNHSHLIPFIDHYIKSQSHLSDTKNYPTK